MTEADQQQSKPKRVAVAMTMGQKLHKFLNKHPEEYDLTFSVGPEKKSVKGVRLLLMAASFKFGNEFNQIWKSQVNRSNYFEDDADADATKATDATDATDAVRNKEVEFRIPLPELDPVAFELFMRLLILDTWSFEELKALELSAQDLLNLISVCRRFEMNDEVQNLESLVNILIRNFENIVQTDHFLLLSQANLKRILSSELIPVGEREVLRSACIWAKAQCVEKKIKLTEENLRSVLGSCLYEIRFAFMPQQEFKEMAEKELQNLLTEEEKTEISKLIALEEEEKLKCDSLQFTFNRKPRVKLHTLSLTEGSEIVKYPAFICNGNWYLHNIIQPSHKIAVQSLGFTGPIDADSFYDITVEIVTTVNGYNTETSGKLEKTVFAKKGEIFYFIFDEPFIMEGGPLIFFNWNNYYQIRFSLQGSMTESIIRATEEQASLMCGETEFGVQFHSQQLAVIKFIKL